MVGFHDVVYAPEECDEKGEGMRAGAAQKEQESDGIAAGLPTFQIGVSARTHFEQRGHFLLCAVFLRPCIEQCTTEIVLEFGIKLVPHEKYLPLQNFLKFYKESTLYTME